MWRNAVPTPWWGSAEFMTDWSSCSVSGMVMLLVVQYLLCLIVRGSDVINNDDWISNAVSGLNQLNEANPRRSDDGVSRGVRSKNENYLPVITFIF